jgi:hypothetical protein
MEVSSCECRINGSIIARGVDVGVNGMGVGTMIVGGTAVGGMDVGRSVDPAPWQPLKISMYMNIIPAVTLSCFIFFNQFTIRIVLLLSILQSQLDFSPHLEVSLIPGSSFQRLPGFSVINLTQRPGCV